MLPRALDDGRRERLRQLLEPDRLSRAVRHPSGVVFAARHLLVTTPDLALELRAVGIDALASEFLGARAFPIDAAYFDKQPAANWTVPAHQDRVLPVAFDGARKQRVTHDVAVAEPSATTLSGLLALRIHFDASDADTGALCVVPGSHTRGVLSDAEIGAETLSAFEPCLTGAGDVLLLRPLLLHRSAPSKRAGRRRVLHVVYATQQPDDGSRWRCSG